MERVIFLAYLGRESALNKNYRDQNRILPQLQDVIVEFRLFLSALGPMFGSDACRTGVEESVGRFNWKRVFVV